MIIRVSALCFNLVFNQILEISMKYLYLFILTLFRVVGKRALFWGKGALFRLLNTKNHRHYFEVALFGMALFEVLLYLEKVHFMSFPGSNSSFLVSKLY